MNTSENSILQAIPSEIKDYPIPILYSGMHSTKNLTQFISYIRVQHILIVTEKLIVKIGIADKIKTVLEKEGLIDYRLVPIAAAIDPPLQLSMP